MYRTVSHCAMAENRKSSAATGVLFQPSYASNQEPASLKSFCCAWLLLYEILWKAFFPQRYATGDKNDIRSRGNAQVASAAPGFLEVRFLFLLDTQRVSLVTWPTVGLTQTPCKAHRNNPHTSWASQERIKFPKALAPPF